MIRTDITELDVAWLAGLIDGEGCIGVRNPRNGHGNKRNSVVPRIELGMAHEDTVLRCAELIGGIIGKSVTVTRRTKKGWSRLPQFFLFVCGQEAVKCLLQRLRRHMVTKALEADLILVVIESVQRRRLESTGGLLRPLSMIDHAAIRLCSELKKGRKEAFVEARELLDMVTLSQAARDYGLAEGAEVRQVSSNDNPAQERPAPHLRKAEGDDMTRSSEETQSLDFNGPGSRLHLIKSA
jgi:hypothetical protein